MSSNPTYAAILQTLQEQHDFHKREAQKLRLALEAILAIYQPPVPEPVEVPKIAPSRLDYKYKRGEIRNKVLSYHVDYPVPVSYTSADNGRHNFARQAVSAAIQRHPDVKVWYDLKGVTSLVNSLRNNTAMIEACGMLGLDYGAIREEALALHDVIMTQGEPVIDYRVRS